VTDGPARAGRVPLRRGVLLSRNFRLLVTCNAISLAGSGVSMVAIPFAVLRIGGSAADVGYVATAGLGPLIIVLLVGGVIADRLPRHKVMAGANLLQALAQGTSAALVLSDNAAVWELAAMAATGGIGLGFYYPAAQGLLPHTVSADLRTQANAIDRTVRNAASIGGAALGGLLVSLWGPGLGLAVDAASFAVASVLRIGMRFPKMKRQRATSLLYDLHDGWHEFVSRGWLWAIVAQFAFLTAIAAATINVLGPLVAHSALGGARSWGFIIAGYSVGAVVGGLTMLRFRPDRMLLSAVLAIPMYSVFIFALAVPLAAPLDIVAAFFSGACLEVFNVNWATTLQQEIPPQKLSRISSYDALGNYVLTPVGTAIAGPLASAFGNTAVLTAGGTLVVILPALVLLQPEVRRMRRKTPQVTTLESPSSASPLSDSTGQS